MLLRAGAKKLSLNRSITVGGTAGTAACGTMATNTRKSVGGRERVAVGATGVDTELGNVDRLGPADALLRIEACRYETRHHRGYGLPATGSPLSLRSGQWRTESNRECAFEARKGNPDEMTRRNLSAAQIFALLVLLGTCDAAHAIHKKCRFEKLDCLYRCSIARDLGRLSDRIWHACNIKCSDNSIECERRCLTRISCGGSVAG
jgi:hypothetical protein